MCVLTLTQLSETIGKNPRPEPGNASRGLSTVPGEKRGWDPTDRHGNAGRSPASDHGLYDSWGDDSHSPPSLPAIVPGVLFYDGTKSR